MVGFVVGTINGMAGGASVISYPILLGAGLPPVNAAVTNALGVSSANLFALLGERKNLRAMIASHWSLIVVSMASSAAGAALLLSLPAYIFEKLVPFLLLIATLTLLIPTKIELRKSHKRIEYVAIGASGFYGGYFGPGQGVMVIAALAQDANRDPKTLNNAKNIIVGITSMVYNIIYLFSGRADWLLVLALFIGSSLGGALGGKWASKASPIFYRALVFIIGIGASVWLFERYILN